MTYISADAIPTTAVEALEHFGVKGMKWGVVNEEDGGAQPSGTRPLALTAAENRADPNGPDRRELVKKAALIAGGTVLTGAAVYGLYKLHQNGIKLPNVSEVAKVTKEIQQPTGIIHLARAKNRGLKFHSTGNTPDFFTVFDQLGMNGDRANGYFSKLGDGTVAAKFLDPLGRHDFAGRPIAHDLVIPPNMTSGISSHQDVVDQIWPKIKDTYQQYWDDSLVDKLEHTAEDSQVTTNVLGEDSPETAEEALAHFEALGEELAHILLGRTKS